MTTFRMARFIRQITQKKLELLTGINQTTISYLETGQIRPTPDHRGKLATALDVAVDDLEFPTDYEDGVANGTIKS